MSAHGALHFPVLNTPAFQLTFIIASLIIDVFIVCSAPEEYVKKIPDRASFLGKQFAVVPPKDGRTVDVYFEKQHNWISQVSIVTAHEPVRFQA